MNDSLRSKSVACRSETHLSLESEGRPRLEVKASFLEFDSLIFRSEAIPTSEKGVCTSRGPLNKRFELCCSLASETEPLLAWSRESIENLSLLSTSTQNLGVIQGKQRCHVHQATLHYVWVEPRGDLTWFFSKRDIVDTYLHASRVLALTRPNKASFLLHEGKVWTGIQSQW